MKFFLSSLSFSFLFATCIFGSLVSKSVIEKEEVFLDDKFDVEGGEESVDKCFIEKKSHFDDFTEEELELFVRRSDSDLHSEFKKYCARKNLPKLFVRNLKVNWEYLGPYYTSVEAVFEEFRISEGEEAGRYEQVYVVNQLDFGKNQLYLKLLKEDESGVMKMKASLIKNYMFPTLSAIRIDNVRVNDVNYGPFKLESSVRE